MIVSYILSSYPYYDQQHLAVYYETGNIPNSDHVRVTGNIEKNTSHSGWFPVAVLVWKAANFSEYERYLWACTWTTVHHRATVSHYESCAMKECISKTRNALIGFEQQGCRQNWADCISFAVVLGFQRRCLGFKYSSRWKIINRL